MFYFFPTSAAIVESAIFCVHGGLSPNFIDMEQVWSAYMNFIFIFRRILFEVKFRVYPCAQGYYLLKINSKDNGTASLLSLHTNEINEFAMSAPYFKHVSLKSSCVSVFVLFCFCLFAFVLLYFKVKFASYSLVNFSQVKSKMRIWISYLY